MAELPSRSRECGVERGRGGYRADVRGLYLDIAYLPHEDIARCTSTLYVF